jgi:hypothetical protein
LAVSLAAGRRRRIHLAPVPLAIVLPCAWHKDYQAMLNQPATMRQKPGT